MKFELNVKLEEPSVIYAVGAPGCGKSTRLKPYAQEIDATYLNPDEIRLMILGDELNRTDDTLVWEILNTSVKLALKAGRHVIVDAKNSDPTYRKQDANDYKTYGAKKVLAVYFNRDLEACLENNSLRSRPVPEKDLRAVHEQLRSYPPSLAEGFDEVIEPSLETS